ncbi:MAG TPA: DUF2950 domain-containing protein [Steroidobacteraceae bacterium]|jgi:hypothetical protein|nr:DUF2950 domain-containing protein [Steroidobacteraceae bacterium]
MNKWLTGAMSACWIAITISAAAVPAQAPKSFDSPQQAYEALIAAADRFDMNAFQDIFGPGHERIYSSGEEPRDRERAANFVAQARKGNAVSLDTSDPKRAYIVVGPDKWPFPVPIVASKDGRWSFDAKEGEQEILRRRIGENELDAIGICRGYVEAQHAYALQARSGYEVPQYAQRIISTPGTHDGLAWKNPDGTWGGPVGEKIAHAIQQGYTNKAQPYHGYFFKILKGQGPSAPLGALDFVVKGVMIGGFALVAAPAQYGVTGIKTFMVSHDGVVYQRDFGPESLATFQKMERFDPDSHWSAVLDETD